MRMLLIVLYRSPERVLNGIALDPFMSDKNKRAAKWKGYILLKF